MEGRRVRGEGSSRGEYTGGSKAELRAWGRRGGDLGGTPAPAVVEASPSSRLLPGEGRSLPLTPGSSRLW